MGDSSSNVQYLAHRVSRAAGASIAYNVEAVATWLTRFLAERQHLPLCVLFFISPSQYSHSSLKPIETVIFIPEQTSQDCASPTGESRWRLEARRRRKARWCRRRTGTSARGGREARRRRDGKGLRARRSGRRSEAAVAWVARMSRVEVGWVGEAAGLTLRRPGRETGGCGW
jgi:hypothetical protein